MIDLHSHTTYSDGTDTVEQILMKAQATKLQYFSITDHNCVAAYFDEAMSYKYHLFNGVIIPGVEITTTYRGEIVEILGYGFDVNLMHAELAKRVLAFEQKQIKEFDLLRLAYKKAGIHYDEKAIQFDPKSSSCRKSFWQEIIRYPDNIQKLSHVTSTVSSTAFTRQEVYNPRSIYHVDESSLYPSFQDTIDLIHRCGGVAILAHLYVYANAGIIRDDLKNIVQAYGLDGMECYYPAFTEAQTQDLENFCHENELLKSGGSDYHGSRKPDILLGTGKGNVCVNEVILESWPKHLHARYF